MRLLLSFLLLSLLAYAAFLGIRWIWAEYALLAEAERPRLALMAVLALFCAGLVGGAIRYAGREHAQRGLLEQRFRLYQQALSVLQEEGASPLKRQEIANGLTLLGSREVIQTYRMLETEIAAHGPDTPQSADYFQRLSLAMRSDLRQSNFEIGAVLKVWLPFAKRTG